MLVVAAALAQDAEAPPLVKDPALVEFVQAPYPPEAEAAGIQGSVRLAVALDATGAVTAVEVLAPAGHGLDEAAVEAAKKFRFTPAEDATGPVPVVIEFEYGFTLAPPEAPLTLEGELREMATRTLIAEAVVHVSRDGIEVATATTDAKGHFEIRGLEPGTYTVVAKGLEHQDRDAEITVVAGEVTDLVLWLRARSYRDLGIVGTYERQQPAEITRRTLSIEEVRRVPGTFGDPVRVIQSLPGAARAPFSTGLLVIRGANPDDSNVYVDGVEVPLVYHLGGFRSILNPDVIESVDYLPGGYGVRYGRSIGGVIDVRTQSEYPERVRATLRTDLLDTGVYSEGRVEDVGFAVGARRSYIDAILGIALANQEFYAAPRWFDYQLKLQSLDDGPDELSLLLFGFDDRLIIRTSADAEDELGLAYSTHRLVGSWSHPLSDTLRLQVQPSLGLDATSFGFGSLFEFTLDAALIDVRADLRWTPSGAVDLVAGIDGEASRNDYAIYLSSVPVDGEDPNTETEPVDFAEGRWQGTPDAFAQGTWRPLDDPERLALVAGVRVPTLIRSDTPVASRVEPRVSGRLQVIPGGFLKGGTGLYHQPPQFFSFSGDLAFERAWSSELGWDQSFGPAIKADLTGYYRWMDPLGVGFEGETGVGRAYGAEVMVRHALVDRFFGWVSYTLSRSERNDDGDTWYAFDYDQTHILTAVAGYRLPFDLEASAKAQYVTGNPYTPYDGAIYLMDDGSYLPYATGDTNSARMAPYYAVDLRVEKLFTFTRWQLDLFVDLLNVVHGENPEFILYNYDYTEHAWINGLPFLPSFGFQAEVNL